MAITSGTSIAGTSTIDSIFNGLFQSRTGTQGTIAYSWSDPNSLMGKYTDGSYVIAHFEARGIAPTVLMGGNVTTPTVVSTTPSTVVHGVGNTGITVTGTNFVSGAVVYAGATSLTTGFTNATTLTATILAAQLVPIGTLAITVQNPDGQISNAVTFTMT